MEVIALQARSERGKTPTIQIVRSLLKESNFEETYFEEISNGDFVAILERGNLKLGLAPQGDYPDRLEQYLRFLAEKGCHKSVAAARTKGGTTKVVRQYPHIFFKKTVVLNRITEEEDMANLTDAKKIVALLIQE